MTVKEVMAMLASYPEQAQVEKCILIINQLPSSARDSSNLQILVEEQGGRMTGSCIRRIRHQLGFKTQLAWSKALSVTRVTASNWERRGNEPISGVAERKVRDLIKKLNGK